MPGNACSESKTGDSGVANELMTSPVTQKSAVSLEEFAKVKAIAYEALQAIGDLKEEVSALKRRIIELEKAAPEKPIIEANDIANSTTASIVQYSTGDHANVKLTHTMVPYRFDDDGGVTAGPSTSTATILPHLQGQNNLVALWQKIFELEEANKKVEMPKVKRAKISQGAEDDESGYIRVEGLAAEPADVKVLYIYDSPPLHYSADGIYCPINTFPTSFVVEINGVLNLAYVTGQLHEFLYGSKPTKHNYFNEKVGQKVPYYALDADAVLMVKTLSAARASPALTLEATKKMSIIRCAPIDEIFLCDDRRDETFASACGNSMLRLIKAKRAEARYLNEIHPSRRAMITRYRNNSNAPSLDYPVTRNKDGTYILNV